MSATALRYVLKLSKLCKIYVSCLGAKLQARQVLLQTGEEEPIKGQEEEVRLQVRRWLPSQVAEQ